MSTIAFDLETTGLINPDVDDPNYQPHIIEFGAVKAVDYNLVANNWETFQSMIHPGIPIPPEITKITGINAADVSSAPSLLQAHFEIAKFFTGVEHLVTFNGLGYDLPVLMFNLRRYGLQYQFPWPRYHTDLMMAATDYLGMQGKTGNKPPKLVELHQELFGEGFPDAHRALDDAKATMRCYQELLKRGVL